MANEFLTRSSEQIVGGQYRIGAPLGESADGAVYETEFGDDARPAVVKIRRADTEEADRLIARWRQAFDLSHPNLIRLYATGSSVLHDVHVVYVVMERADESLAAVLVERALSETETREMLAPTLGALKYLHKNGYAHNSLKPSNVLAVGDLLKLSSDSATRTGEGGSPADDIWALGSMIVQALTQHLPKMEPNTGPYILREASQTFTDIVRHCLDPDPEARWTVDQIEARLSMPVPAAAPPVLPPPRRPEPAARIEQEIRAPQAPPRKTPRWIYGALASLVLVVFLVAVARKREVGPVTVAPPPPVSEQASQPPVTAPEPSTPEVSRPAEVTPPAPGAAGKKAARKEEGWSVIVAAYNFREPAEKRVKSLAEKFPKFNLSIYEQHADKIYYLVVIGQNISEDRADALRKRAISAGLPRDTYIKKLP
jgi:eukaryotic-like serine/threonine-protein kinase